ncbi:hypothetical protein GCM10010391_03670 [Streptomyces anthocyanicus]|nr:hypothetical protein GCM10010391_03670 [Streptomyces anthocyanicus]
MLPCPASARSRIALGLVPTYPRSHSSSRVDSISRSEVFMQALYILVVTEVERAKRSGGKQTRAGAVLPTSYAHCRWPYDDRDPLPG